MFNNNAVLARMLTRRRFSQLGVAGLAALAAAPKAFASDKRYEPVDLGNGRLTQDWFLESFLEIKDDLSEAVDSGKRLAILWEQDGCPYCREMHMVNFAIPEIREFVEENFLIVQLDIWGSREVTDFAGEVMRERDLAKAWKVRFTPTIQFLTDDGAVAAANNPKTFEVSRMPGYLRPMHFLWMFEFVHEKAYTESDFRAFVNAKVKEFESQKKPFPNWG